MLFKINFCSFVKSFSKVVSYFKNMMQPHGSRSCWMLLILFSYYLLITWIALNQKFLLCVQYLKNWCIRKVKFGNAKLVLFLCKTSSSFSANGYRRFKVIIETWVEPKFGYYVEKLKISALYSQVLQFSQILLLFRFVFQKYDITPYLGSGCRWILLKLYS